MVYVCMYVRVYVHPKLYMSRDIHNHVESTIIQIRHEICNKERLLGIVWALHRWPR